MLEKNHFRLNALLSNGPDCPYVVAARARIILTPCVGRDNDPLAEERLALVRLERDARHLGINGNEDCETAPRDVALAVQHRTAARSPVALDDGNDARVGPRRHRTRFRSDARRCARYGLIGAASPLSFMTTRMTRMQPESMMNNRFESAQKTVAFNGGPFGPLLSSMSPLTPRARAPMGPMSGASSL
jgi:hypothetical protein